MQKYETENSTQVQIDDGGGGYWIFGYCTMPSPDTAKAAPRWHIAGICIGMRQVQFTNYVFMCK